jgi:hypothetical protein
MDYLYMISREFANLDKCYLPHTITRAKIVAVNLIKLLRHDNYSNTYRLERWKWQKATKNYIFDTIIQVE